LWPKYKNIFTNLYFHIWLIAKSWLNFVTDDLEEDYKIEKMKILKIIIDVIIIITIIYLFIKFI